MVGGKIRSAAGIGLLLFRRIMLGTVQFNDKVGAGTVEIGNVAANGLLALKSHRTVAEIVIPKFALPRCHVLAQMPRKRNVAWVVGAHGGLLG